MSSDYSPRNLAFANNKWTPAGSSLKLRQGSVAGPFGFLNPTTAVYDIDSNHGASREDLADLTDAERQERARIRWNARDYRKGRHILILPRHAPLASRLEDSASAHKILLGIGRMFTMFPYWDISWLIGISFTIGCMIFIGCGFLYWLPVAYAETEFEGESDVVGGSLVFVGATLFQIGAVLLFLESYNDRAETKFGGAMEDLFVNRLKIAHRVRHHRPVHYDAENPPVHDLGRDDESDRPHSGSTDSSNTLAASHGDSDRNLGNVSPATHKPRDFGNDNAFTEREWQWWPSWHDVTTHYMYEIGFLASFTMSLGATVFYICGIMALPGVFSSLSEGVLQGVYYLSYLIGGILFWVSSVMYVLETQPNWYTPQPFKIGWYVGAFNMIGGIGWTYAAAMGYCNPEWCEYQSQLALIWASTGFTIGSGLQWYESLDKYVIKIKD